LRFTVLHRISSASARCLFHLASGMELN